MAGSNFKHRTVLLDEAVETLITDPEGFYIDGTFGRGGHSRLILQHLGSQGRLLAFDKDPQAVAVGQELEQQDKRFAMVHGSFAQMCDEVSARGRYGQIAGVLLDLGVSSPQLDDAQRGFSFLKEGPLDMRMDNTEGALSAQQWLNQAGEKEIADVLRVYGEERFHRRIAKAIVQQRIENPLATTRQLAELIERVSPRKEKHKHPATRSFQAIRIFINRELEDLETGLKGALDVLKPGGRLAVISFHSLEDRIVKQFIRREEQGDPLPRGLPVTDDQIKRRLKTVVKARKPTEQEVQENPRARSAVFRVAEKLA